MRRWQAGDEGYSSGVRWRVVQGYKSEDDLRLEFHLGGEWRAVQMELGFLLSDFFFENEHVLYPRTQGYRGGWKYFAALQRAARAGYKEAAFELCREKEQRRLRT